jgi:hypothetical protein
MKKLVLYLFILILSVKVLDKSIAYCCDKLYSKVRTGQTGGKINQYLSLSPTPDLLIMGDSRAFRHINPDSFPIPTYNIGHAGMDQCFQTALLHVLLTNKKLPKNILLQIEPYNYTRNKGEPDQFSDGVQQLKFYYNSDTLVRRYINEISPNEKYKFLFDSYRYNGILINLFKNFYESRHTKNYGNGFEPMPCTLRDSINVVATSKREIDTSKLQMDSIQVEYLKTFIKICEDHKVKLICFSSNIYTQFLDYKVYSLKIGAILQQYKVPYINYIIHHDTNLNNPYLWQDSYHLNENGAKIESKHLSVDVMNIINNVK